MTDLSILEQALLTCDAPESVWRPALDAIKAQIDDLKSAGRQARDDATAALDLMSRVRMALNDNGKRMQDELIDYCRDLARMPYRIQKLREGILEARREGCACDFHLYGEDQELDSDGALDAYCTMEQALNEAQLAQAQWTEVSEGLPPESSKCLIVTDEGILQASYVHSGMFFSGGHRERPSHWMLQPEPPKP